MQSNAIQGLNTAQAPNRLTVKHIPIVSNRETLTKRVVFEFIEIFFRKCICNEFLHKMESIHSFVLIEKLGFFSNVPRM